MPSASLSAFTRHYRPASGGRQPEPLAALMLGSRSHGVAGHVQVMWGARVRGGYPQVEVIDPLTTSGSPVSISVVSIRSYSGGFTVWAPTRLPLLS